MKFLLLNIPKKHCLHHLFLRCKGMDRDLSCIWFIWHLFLCCLSRHNTQLKLNHNYLQFFPEQKMLTSFWFIPWRSCLRVGLDTILWGNWILMWLRILSFYWCVYSGKYLTGAFWLFSRIILRWLEGIVRRPQNSCFDSFSAWLRE